MAAIDRCEETQGTRAIACMEVWGGCEAFRGSVSVPGNDVHVVCEPHVGGTRGGDTYYVSNCAAGLITRFILADIAGHGEEAAAFSRELRGLMRRHINTADQSRFAMALNGAFSALELSGRFATAVLLTYFAPTDHLIVCNAGHPRPLLYRASEGRWSALDSGAPGAFASGEHAEIGVANLPLGVLDPTNYHQFALRLERGDRVVLYSDALIEAKNSEGRQLGESGLVDLANLVEASVEEFPAALRRAVGAWSGSKELDDDVTMILLHHNAANPPRVGWRDRPRLLAHMLGLGGVDSGPGGE